MMLSHDKEDGKVQNVFIKVARKKPMVVPADACLKVKAKFGIEEDINANPKSPRHILLVESETLQAYGLVPGSLRENLITEGLSLNSMESGDVLQIGDLVKIRITFSCEICSFIAKLQLPSPETFIGKRGMLGIILTSGVIAIHDPITYLGKQFPPLPTRFTDRLLWYVDQIPNGKVVTYTSLTEAVGGASSYARAIPGIIQRTNQRKHNVHRIVDSTGRLIPYISNQKQLLQKEGVEISDENVLLKAHLWDSCDIYY